MLCCFGLLSMCLMKVRRGELIQSFREAVGDAQPSCHPASGGWRGDEEGCVTCRGHQGVEVLCSEMLCRCCGGGGVRGRKPDAVISNGRSCKHAADSC